MATRCMTFLLLLFTLLVDEFAADALAVTSNLAKHRATSRTGSKTLSFTVNLFRELPGSRPIITTSQAPPHPTQDSTIALEEPIPTLSVTSLPFVPSTPFGDRCLSLVRDLSSDVKSLMAKSLRDSWWTFPMSLAVGAGYSSFIRKVPPRMPSWWALTNISHLVDCKSIIGFFLGSNVAFLMAGAYLLQLKASSSAQREKTDPMLGILLIASGLVSLIFHHQQGYGSVDAAHLLCYLDHGVAITTIFRFGHSCGLPGLPTWILSALGLVTLSLTGPGYAWLHSAWHIIAAIAACTWFHDSERRAASKGEQQVLPLAV